MRGSRKSIGSVFVFPQESGDYTTGISSCLSTAFLGRKGRHQICVDGRHWINKRRSVLHTRSDFAGRNRSQESCVAKSGATLYLSLGGCVVPRKPAQTGLCDARNLGKRGTDRNVTTFYSRLLWDLSFHNSTKSLARIGIARRRP